MHWRLNHIDMHQPSSSDCGQFTTCPGRCVVLKNTGCTLFSRARLLSRIASRLVSRISSDHRSSWLACSLLSALGTAPLATDRLAAQLRSRITALLGTRVCLACVTLLGSTWLLGSALCSLRSARLRLLGSWLFISRLAALLGQCGSARLELARIDWLGSRL